MYCWYEFEIGVEREGAVVYFEIGREINYYEVHEKDEKKRLVCLG